MAQRESADHRKVEREVDVDDETTAVVEASPSDLDSEVDSILDEIDSVLEENAEDFVKSFVQKGGQ